MALRASTAGPNYDMDDVATESDQTHCRVSDIGSIQNDQTNFEDGVTGALAAPKPQQPSVNSVQLQTVQGMKIFRKEVDQQTLNRFQDVVDRVQAPLIEKMRKTKREYRPIAIRLMILGDDEASAKPWIVVLCPEHTSKTVKKFFNKRQTKAIYQSDSLGDFQFEVAVIAQAIRSKNAEDAIEVFGMLKPSSSASQWNSPIKISHKGKSRFATLGGVIRVNMFDDSHFYYGTTAGHIIDHESNLVLPDIGEDSEQSSDDDDDDDTIKGGSVQEQGSAQQWYSSSAEVLALTHSRQDEHDWASIGFISNASFSLAARNRDWALIESVTDSSFQTTTLLKIQDTHFDRTMLDWNAKSPMTETAFEIGLLKEGKLQTFNASCLPAVVLLPSGHSFVSVYTVHLSDDFVLGAGSSGSWLINASCKTVYGHVVADDPFGDVFVIPILDMFADIKGVLKAKSVSLAGFGIQKLSRSMSAEPAPPEYEYFPSKPPIIHNGGGPINDPNTSTSAPNAGYYS